MKNILKIRVLGLDSDIRKVRVDVPLSYLNSADIQISHDAIKVEEHENPGVFVFHRQNIHTKGRLAFVNELAKRGWVVVMDFDDDPRAFKDIVESNFIGFKSVHAVTASTPNLAQLIRQWNPYVQILPNVVDDKHFKLRIAEDYTKKINIIFAAYNRTKDVQPLDASITRLQSKYGDLINWVVVYDKHVPQILNGASNLETYNLVTYSDYITLMQRSHIALLPLLPTAFNSMKSDLKFIECCATGVIPICAETVYRDTDVSARIGLFPKTTEDWFDCVSNLIDHRQDIYPRVLNGYEYVHQHRLASRHAAFRSNFYRYLMHNQRALEAERSKRCAT